MEAIKTVEYRIELKRRQVQGCPEYTEGWIESTYSDPSKQICDVEGSSTDLNLQVRRIKRLQSRSTMFDYRLVEVTHTERIVPVKFNPFA